MYPTEWESRDASEIFCILELCPILPAQLSCYITYYNGIFVYTSLQIPKYFRYSYFTGCPFTSPAYAE